MIVKAVYILLGQYGRDVIYQDAFTIINHPQRDNESRSTNGTAVRGAWGENFPEEVEEEEEEFQFIFMKENTNSNYFE